MSLSESPYGVHRVVGTRSLPQPADRLDPTLPCGSTEVEVAVEHLHIDASSLRQLRTEHRGDLHSVRAALLTLVKERGKLHNRVTNSGGILVGRVRAVGADYPNPPAVGTRIATRGPKSRGIFRKRLRSRPLMSLGHQHESKRARVRACGY